MKLLEAGETEGGKHLIPKAIDADDEDDVDDSSDDESDDEVADLTFPQFLLRNRLALLLLTCKEAFNARSKNSKREAYLFSDSL